MAYALAEDVTLTTYYPSPRGVYKELQVTELVLNPPGNLQVPGSLAVGPTASLGNAGDVSVQGTVLITNADGVGPSLSAELGNGQFFNVTPQGIGVAGPPAEFSGTPTDQTFTLHGGDHATVLLNAGNAVIGGLAAALTPIGPVPPGLALGTASAHALNLVTNFQPRMSITSGGNVGIGTMTPGQKLEVAVADGESQVVAIKGINERDPDSLGNSIGGRFEGKSYGLYVLKTDGAAGGAAIYADSDGAGLAADFRGPIQIIGGPIQIMDGTQGLNKVLTSDANGFASWRPSCSIQQTSGGITLQEAITNGATGFCYWAAAANKYKVGYLENPSSQAVTLNQALVCDNDSNTQATSYWYMACNL